MIVKWDFTYVIIYIQEYVPEDSCHEINIKSKYSLITTADTSSP